MDDGLLVVSRFPLFKVSFAGPEPDHNQPHIRGESVSSIARERENKTRAVAENLHEPGVLPTRLPPF